jgi:hypothetical protein
VEGTNIPNGNALVNKVEINLNMLGALVLNGVCEKVGNADVVTVDQSGPRQGVVQFHKQLTKPACLCHTVGHNAVLGLSPRVGDDVLTLRGPGDKVVALEHRIA